MLQAVLGRAAGLSEASLAALPVVGEFRQEESLRETTHRPWLLPDRPWFMGQSWCDRRYYRLPYFLAKMTHSSSGGQVNFSSNRISGDGPPADLEGRCMPIGSPCPPAPRSPEHFLTERYCLYTLDDEQRALRADIHRPPWPLQRATAELEVNTMTEPLGVELFGEPLFHFSRRQDVALWRLVTAD